MIITTTTTTKRNYRRTNEMMVLLQAAQKGDKVAQEQLILANTGLVIHLARRYMHNSADYTLDDLIQEGQIGLMKAIERYDSTRGSFSTCASLWILQAIREALRSKAAMVHIPCYLEPTFKQLKQLEAEQPELTLSELAQQLDTTIENIACLRALTYVKSLDIPMGDDGSTILDMLVDESTLDDIEVCEENTDIHVQAEKALAVLNEREKYIIRLRYGLNADDGAASTLTAISLKLGISKERVRQVETMAMKKMRAAMAQVGSPISLP